VGWLALTSEGCARAKTGPPAPAGRFLPPIAPANPPANPPAGQTGPPANNDCVSGLANFNLSMGGARRIPLGGEEAQVALGYAVFIRRPGSSTPRNVFSEWFVIDENKIKTIYT